MNDSPDADNDYRTQEFVVINPATEGVAGSAPRFTPESINDTVETAAKAGAGWSRSESSRRDALQAMADVIEESAAEIAPLLTAEQGKPLARALDEFRIASRWCRYFADRELPVRVLRDDEEARVEVRRYPVGVVAAITPWNFPIATAFWKIAPALLAGNTVVLKPSPYTPLSSLALVSALTGVLPDGVLSCVSGEEPVGAMLVSHPLVRKVSLTGSIATGKTVASVVGNDLKRVTMELGGNDAAIVLPDVDVESIVDGLFWGAFGNSGQICSAIKRLYVHDSVHDSVVNGLVKRAESVTIGNGMLPQTELGPIQNATQFARVSSLVDGARAAGGRVVTGGCRIGTRGYFYSPTIVTDVEDVNPLVAEEQFGPALPILRYSDVGDAIARANSTQFGLSGSVWGESQEDTSRVAQSLECGTVWINSHRRVGPEQPVAGIKWSGIGTENGDEGIESYTQLKVVYRALNIPSPGY